MRARFLFGCGTAALGFFMPNIDTLQNRVVQLEELFSHHQHHVQQLNEVIVKVRDELDALKAKCAIQQSRLDSLSDSRSFAEDEDPADQKPPHY
jgi:uncharacterized coiled-coil protein SlyX